MADAHQGDAWLEHRVFNCPAQEERCEWDPQVPTPHLVGPGESVIIWATDAHSGYGYRRGEALMVGFAQNSRRFSYGYNAWGVGDRRDRSFLGLGAHIGGLPPYKEVHASRVRKPVEMIAIGDSHVDGHADFELTPIDELGHRLPGAVHHRGANILFCDGHVEWYLQKDLINAAPTNPSPKARLMRRMWNNDNEP